MSEWNVAQEASFQELVLRAQEQSRAYYERREKPLCLPTSVVTYQPQPTQKPSTRPHPAPQRPNSGITPPHPAPQCPASGGTPPPQQLDNEGLMLATLLWLLIEEKADMKIIMALGYILLV